MRHHLISRLHIVVMGTALALGGCASSGAANESGDDSQAFASTTLYEHTWHAPLESAGDGAIKLLFPKDFPRGHIYQEAYADISLKTDASQGACGNDPEDPPEYSVYPLDGSGASVTLTDTYRARGDLAIGTNGYRIELANPLKYFDPNVMQGLELVISASVSDAEAAKKCVAAFGELALHLTY
jgi:hypothetical protein